MRFREIYNNTIINSKVTLLSPLATLLTIMGLATLLKGDNGGKNYVVQQVLCVNHLWPRDMESLFMFRPKVIYVAFYHILQKANLRRTGVSQH